MEQHNSQTQTKLKLAWSSYFVAFTLYALIILAMSWPAPTQLSQKLIGNNVDNWIFYWNNWWVMEALQNGESIFFTDMLFHPTGTSLVAHSHSILNSLLAIPITLISTPVFAYNVVILLGLWLSGIGMFLYVYELVDSKTAAFLSGLVYAIAPYHLTQALAHYHLSAIQWWPFYALMLHRLLHKRQWRDVVATAVFAALTVWSGLQLGLLLILWTILYLGWHIQKTKVAWRQLLGVTAVSAILCLPIILPLTSNRLSIQTAQSFDESLTKQTDLLAYVVPSVNHPLWGEASRPIYERFIVNQAFMPFIGYTVLLLLGIGVWHRWRSARFWLVATLLWLLLASGSALRFNGTLYKEISLPYALLSNVFPISLIRSPDRFNLLLVFTTAVLVGFGTAVVLKRQKWLIAPLTLLIMVEFWLYPLPMWELPPAGTFLETNPPTGAIIDYPMGYTNSKFWLYYQTTHQQPIIEGHVSRFSSEIYSHIFTNPLTNQLYAHAEFPPNLKWPVPESGTVTAVGPALRDLQAKNINTLAVHNSYASAEELAYLNELLPLIPAFKDETIAVYDFAQPRPWQFGTLPQTLTDSLMLVENEILLDSENQALSLYFLLELTAVSSPLLNCNLILSNQTFLPLSSLSLAEGVAGDLFQIQESIMLPQNLPIGKHPLQLQCHQNPPILLTDSLVIEENGRYLTQHPLHITYQDNILLQEYRQWMRGSTLHLELQWLPLANGIGDYKLFIHLLDENNSIVRQLDTVPCQWQCPTSQWQANSLIIDKSSLDLWGIPPGKYQIALGLYNSQTAERLTAIQNNAHIPDAYAILPTSVTIQSASPTPE